jgi:type IV secretion system protein TrbL
MATGVGQAGWAAGSAAKDKAIAAPGAYANSLLGLANAKLDEAKQKSQRRPAPPPLQDS